MDVLFARYVQFVMSRSCGLAICTICSELNGVTWTCYLRDFYNL